MKPLERLSHRVTVTAGIILLAMMMALVLWSSAMFARHWSSAMAHRPVTLPRSSQLLM